MEKEGMIKIVALGVAILAIAVPIMISCMNGLADDGTIETYNAPVEYEEAGTVIITTPTCAYDMVEYAKKRGATSWDFDIGYMTHSYTLYKNGNIIERVEEDDNTAYGSANQILAYIHEDGFGYLFDYSVRPYLVNEIMNTYGSHRFMFVNDGTNTTINTAKWVSEDENDPEVGHYEVDQHLQTVKMKNMWFHDVRGNYLFGKNSQPQYINNEDIYYFTSIQGSPVTMVHGNDVTVMGNGETAKGNVNYYYSTSDDSPVKTLTGMDLSVEWDGMELSEHEGYDGMIWDTITPITMTYKEPYSKGMLGAVLSIIPIVVFVGIGMYVFGRLSNGGGGE